MTPTEAVQELIRRRWTQLEIAVQVGITQPTVAKIGAGKMEPRYSIGKKLVDMAQERKRA